MERNKNELGVITKAKEFAQIFLLTRKNRRSSIDLLLSHALTESQLLAYLSMLAMENGCILTKQYENIAKLSADCRFKSVKPLSCGRVGVMEQRNPVPFRKLILIVSEEHMPVVRRIYSYGVFPEKKTAGLTMNYESTAGPCSHYRYA